MTDSFPFKGIVQHRMYPPTGLTTELWPEKTKIQRIPLSNIYLTQSGVFIRPLFSAEGSYSGDPMPHAVLWRGNFYLEDGHHRAVKIALRGGTAIYARVFISPLGN